MGTWGGCTEWWVAREAMTKLKPPRVVLPKHNVAHDELPPPLFQDLIRIPIIIPFKGREVMNQGSGLASNSMKHEDVYSF